MEKENKIFEKRNFYTEDDSGKIYILSLLIPILVSLFMFMLCSGIFAMAGKNPDILSEQIWYRVISAVVSSLSFVFIYLIYNKIYKVSNKIVNYDFKMGWQNYIIAVFVGLIVLLGMQNFIGLFDKLWEKIGFQLQTTSLPINTFGFFVLNVLVSAVAPAICEEIVFRGVILNGLRSKFKDGICIVLSALMFALMHGSLQQLVYPFLFGIILAILYMRTGSIIACMLTHFTNNFFVLLFSYLQTKTNISMILPTTWWGIIISILLVFVVFAIIFLIDKFYYKHKNKYETDKQFGRTSLFLWVSLGVAVFLFIFNLIFALS